jgi:hypothetical protein
MRAYRFHSAIPAPETTSTFLGSPGIFKAAETTSTFLGSPGIFKAETTSTFLGSPGIFKAAQTTSTFLGSPGIFKAAQTTSTFLGSPGIFKPAATAITFSSGCPPFNKPPVDAAATFPHCPGVFKAAQTAQTTSTFLGSPGIFKADEAAITFSSGCPPFNNKPGEAAVTFPHCPGVFKRAAETTSTFLGSPGIFKAAETTSTFLGSPGIFKAAPTAAAGVFPPARYYWLTGSSSGIIHNVTSSGTIQAAPTSASGYVTSRPSTPTLVEHSNNRSSASPAQVTSLPVLTTASGADDSLTDSPVLTELTTLPLSTITESLTRTTTQLVALNPSYKQVSISIPPCPNGLTVTVTVIATDVVAAPLPSVGVKNFNLTVTETGLPIFTGSFITSQTAPSNSTSVTTPTPTGPSVTGAVGATDVNLAFLVGFVALAIFV